MLPNLVLVSELIFFSTTDKQRNHTHSDNHKHCKSHPNWKSFLKKETLCTTCIEEGGTAKSWNIAWSAQEIFAANPSWSAYIRKHKTTQIQQGKSSFIQTMSPLPKLHISYRCHKTDQKWLFQHFSLKTAMFP